MTKTIKSYPQCDSENDREEGVTSEINKCNKCDSDKGKKISLTWEMMTMTVEMKSCIGRDSGHDGDEGVTAGIKKCAECDSDDKILPKM